MTPGDTTRHLRIAGRSARLETAGAAVHAALRPALDHLVSPDPPPSTALRWLAWEDDVPHPLWVPEPAGPMRLPGGGLALSCPDPPTVDAYLPGEGVQLWGAVGALAAGDIRAHPAGTAMAAWLGDTGLHVLHAGAVERDGGAALLVGAAGGGKSTTVLACAERGAGFVGDDLCVIEPEAGPTVHALYATAKCNADSSRELDAGHWPTLGDTPQGKRVVAVQDTTRLVPSAPISALVFLDPPASAVEGPCPVEPREAARALTPTALMAALGAGGLRRWFRASMALARSVPAFRLTVAWDLDAVAAAVDRAIEAGADLHGR